MSLPAPTTPLTYGLLIACACVPKEAPLEAPTRPDAEAKAWAPEVLESSGIHDALEMKVELDTHQWVSATLIFTNRGSSVLTLALPNTYGHGVTSPLFLRLVTDPDSAARLVPVRIAHSIQYTAEGRLRPGASTTVSGLRLGRCLKPGAPLPFAVRYAADPGSVPSGILEVKDAMTGKPLRAVLKEGWRGSISTGMLSLNCASFEYHNTWRLEIEEQSGESNQGSD